MEMYKGEEQEEFANVEKPQSLQGLDVALAHAVGERKVRELNCLH